MRRFWLLFAQAVTIALGVVFVIAVLRPDWLERAPTRVGIGGPAAQVPVLQAPGGPTPGSYREAAGRAMPAVVNILTSKALREAHPLLKDPFFRRFFGDKPPPQEQMASLGSGVIVSSEGYILTNFHVVEGADEIEVGLADGRKAAASIVGTDPETDLAVIRIKADKLPVIVLGDPTRRAWATSCWRSAIPSASARPSRWASSRRWAATTCTSTTSRISSRPMPRSTSATRAGRWSIPRQPARHQFGDLFADRRLGRHRFRDSRHDRQGRARIHHQEWPGGARLDRRRIPGHHARAGQQLRPGRERGAIIAGVVRGGPADRAGMRPGDILLAVDGKQVSNTNDMLNLIADLRRAARRA
jgi:serine protease DegQ